MVRIEIHNLYKKGQKPVIGSSLMEKQRKEKFRKKVGRIVERLHLEKGMSRKELGLQLRYKENTAVQAVSRFESGRAGIPKAKIETLIELLEMENSDFGLESTRLLKSFISASGFLGFPMHPLEKAMVDYIDTQEVEVGKNAVSDRGDDELAADGESGKYSPGYFDVARLMKLYRAGTKGQSFSLLESLEAIDALCGDHETAFVDVLASLNISALDAYSDIEAAILKKLQQS